MTRLLFISACLGLSSCAGIADPVAAPPQKVTSLPAQSLAPGDCGLFIWTANNERRFILFSQSQTQKGVWYSRGDIHMLTVKNEAGEPANEQFPETSYMTLAGTKLSISLAQRETITDGTRFKSGTLKVFDPEAWERVMPVVGLSACQTS